MIMLAAALLLAPHLAEDAPLRLVSDGTGDEAVIWLLDGQRVAVTRDGTAASVNVTAGAHELWATTAFDGPWTALARPAPAGDDVAYVPAWTAQAEGTPEAAGTRSLPDWLLPLALAVLAFGIVLWPSKHP